MTIEDLKTLVHGDIIEISNGEKYYYRGKFSDGSIAIYEFGNGTGRILHICDNCKNIKISINGCPINLFEFSSIKKLSEKEVLEIQLKEAKELVQKETARVDSIKAKIEELSKPKLKIGGLYKFEKFGNDFIGVVINIDRNAGWYGVLNHRLNGIITYNIEHYKVTEITNPKYSHIGPTILEFMKLNPENFQ